MITVAYIGILFLYFWRRTKKQDGALTDFLEQAKKQLEQHKVEAHSQASVKVNKAFTLIKRLQTVASDLEANVQTEYDEILKAAKEQAKDIIEDAHQKAEDIVAQADDDLEQYREERQREVEKDMVKLIIQVTEKVVGKGFAYKEHLHLIEEALEEVKQKKERA